MKSVIIISCQVDSGMAGNEVAAKLGARVGKVTVLESILHAQTRFAFVQSADIALVILGPQWATFPPGTPGIDTMRTDIDYLFRYNKPALILPILVHGATMPKAIELPPNVQQLAYVQALSLDAQLDDSVIKQIIARVRAARSAALQTLHAKGSYRWFKALSFAPFIAISLYGLGNFLYGYLHLSLSTGQQQDLALIGRLFFIASLLIVWIGGIVVASQAQRLGWLIVNVAYITYLPLALLFFITLNIVQQSIPGVLYAAGITVVVLLALLMEFQPIAFGLNVPPFRKRYADI